jgi:pyruvate dehydrogenase E1 component alpha subunit
MEIKELNWELYRTMYLIRRCEEKIISLYPSDDMKTPMHMSMGEEALVSGVVHALQIEDQVVGTYRSHALYLAKTLETDHFFAEMYGKASGVAHGKAGSMHLSAPGKGLLYCSAIVASALPIAMGIALANKYKKNRRNVAVFFGDGAIDEGVFWETINFACLKKLPLLFICEDNGFAVHTPREYRHGFKSINDIIAKFDCNIFEEKSTDPEIIYNLTKKALAMLKENERPSFLRLHYYRYLEHVGINEDFDAGYRPKEEYLQWFEKDPIRMQKDKLTKIGFSSEEIMATEQNIDKKIAQSIIFAKESHFTNASDLYRGVFICE